MFENIGIQRFVARWLAALLLVLATYNPSGYSYYHWIGELEAGNWILKLLVGVVLAILYATFGLATQRSLGRLGDPCDDRAGEFGQPAGGWRVVVVCAGAPVGSGRHQ